MHDLRLFCNRLALWLNGLGHPLLSLVVFAAVNLAGGRARDNREAVLTAC